MIVAGILLSGCTTTLPSVSEYRLSVKENKQLFSQTDCKVNSLKLGQAFSSSSLMTLNMNYGLGEHKQFAYTQSQWAKTPNSAVSDALVHYIKETELFKNVQISKSRSNNSMLLETNIEDFMQYFSEDEKSSYSNVRISLTLIDTQTNRVVSTQTFSSKVEVLSSDANGGVVALNSALNNVLKEAVSWLGESCR